MNKIVFILPAYNEEKNIEKLLSDLTQLSLPCPKSVILVNDGSIDRTEERARKFIGSLDLTIIAHKKNSGVPKTFFDGFVAASKVTQPDDVIIMIEGDNTSDLKLVSGMITKVNEGADIVIASRYIKGGCYKNFPLQRTIGSKIVNIILKLSMRIKGVSDYSIFYRAYRADVIQKSLEKYKEKFITTKSFAANLEVLMKMVEFSKKIDEVPLVYDYGLKKGASKMKVLKTLFEYKDLILNKFFKK